MNQKKLLKILRIFLLLIGMFLSGSVWATRVDNLEYSLNEILLTATVSYNSDATGDIVIPSEVTHKGKTYKVESIVEKAFYMADGLRSVSIPSSVKIVESWAFYYCKNLVSVSVAPGMMRIESSVFSGTPWLDAQPDGPVYLGSVFYTYKGKADPQTVLTVRDGTVSVSPLACYNKKNIVSVILPTSIRWIGYSAFVNTGWYDNQPDGLLYINSVLYQYKGRMPEDTRIDVREGTTLIAEDAFNNLSDLELVEVILPSSLQYIGEKAFSGHSKLTSLIIPHGVKEIDDEAFRNCPLRRLELGNSLEKIGRNVFYLSNNLKKPEIYSYSLFPPVCDVYTFKGTYYDRCTLYVPKGTKESYSEATGWEYFNNIQEFEDGTGLWSEKEDSKVCVSSFPGGIQIDAPNDLSISVKNMAGLLIYQGTKHRISLDRGIYVVIVGGKSNKIVVY